MTDKEKLNAIRAEVEEYIDAARKAHTNITEGNFAHLLSFIDSLQEEPVSEDLEEAALLYYPKMSRISEPHGVIPADNQFHYLGDANEDNRMAFKTGAKWQKVNIWKDAQGDDLPEIDREVIVLIKYNTQRNIHDKEYSTYKVGFGHRPNPDGWDGKNIDTNEVAHYTPKLYDNGGWNAPDIVYWLDIELPKEIEL